MQGPGLMVGSVSVLPSTRTGDACRLLFIQLAMTITSSSVSARLKRANAPMSAFQSSPSVFEAPISAGILLKTAFAAWAVPSVWRAPFTKMAILFNLDWSRYDETGGVRRMVMTLYCSHTLGAVTR